MTFLCVGFKDSCGLFIVTARSCFVVPTILNVWDEQNEAGVTVLEDHVCAAHEERDRPYPDRPVRGGRQQQNGPFDDYERAGQGAIPSLVDCASRRKLSVGRRAGVPCSPGGPRSLLRCQRDDAREGQGAEDENGGKAQPRRPVSPMGRQEKDEEGTKVGNDHNDSHD